MFDVKYIYSVRNNCDLVAPTVRHPQLVIGLLRRSITDWYTDKNMAYDHNYSKHGHGSHANHACKTSRRSGCEDNVSRGTTNWYRGQHIDKLDTSSYKIALHIFCQLFHSVCHYFLFLLLPRYVETYAHARFEVDGNLMCRVSSFVYYFLLTSSSLTGWLGFKHY